MGRGTVTGKKPKTWWFVWELGEGVKNMGYINLRWGVGEM